MIDFIMTAQSPIVTKSIIKPLLNVLSMKQMTKSPDNNFIQGVQYKTYCFDSRQKIKSTSDQTTGNENVT